MATSEFVTENINLKILNQTVYILYNINVLNMLFLKCDLCKINLVSYVLEILLIMTSIIQY